MLKKILGWFLVVFGLVGCVSGFLIYFGGEPFLTAFKMFVLGFVMLASGLGLALAKK